MAWQDKSRRRWALRGRPYAMFAAPSVDACDGRLASAADMSEPKGSSISRYRHRTIGRRNGPVVRRSPATFRNLLGSPPGEPQPDLHERFTGLRACGALHFCRQITRAHPQVRGPSRPEPGKLRCPAALRAGKFLGRYGGAVYSPAEPADDDQDINYNSLRGHVLRWSRPAAIRSGSRTSRRESDKAQRKS